MISALCSAQMSLELASRTETDDIVISLSRFVQVVFRVRSGGRVPCPIGRCETRSRVVVGHNRIWRLIVRRTFNEPLSVSHCVSRPTLYTNRHIFVWDGFSRRHPFVS